MKNYYRDPRNPESRLSIYMFVVGPEQTTHLAMTHISQLLQCYQIPSRYSIHLSYAPRGTFEIRNEEIFPHYELMYYFFSRFEYFSHP